jgi:hypothetical protein
MLSHYLAEVPHHYWDVNSQTFIAELKSDGVVVQRYTIPRHVFFAIHADMARAIQDACSASGAEIVELRKAEG